MARTPKTVVNDENPAVEAKELDLDFVSGGAFTLSADLAKESAPQRERNAKQQAMDKVVQAAYDIWASSGKPTTWARLMETQSVKSYFVQPDQASEIKRLINSAVKLHEVRARYGSEFAVGETHIEKYNLPPDYLGRTVISFAVMDKRPRAAAVNGDGTSVNGDENGGDEG